MQDGPAHFIRAMLHVLMQPVSEEIKERALDIMHAESVMQLAAQVRPPLIPSTACPPACTPPSPLLSSQTRHQKLRETILLIRMFCTTRPTHCTCVSRD